MADVNWRKYDCDLCLAVTLAAAAAVSALVTVGLGSAGMGVALQVIAFLIIWAVLGWVADGICAARSSGAAVGPHDHAGEDARLKEADAAADAAAKAEATARAEADAKAAEQAAEAEAKAAEEKAAEQKAAKEAAAAKAATEEKAAAEAAAKKAAEDKAAAEAAAKKEAEAAAKKAAEEQAAAEAAAEAEAKSAAGSDDVDRDGDGIIEGTDEGTRPEALDGPRGGTADDLKRIKGIGPKLEQLCNSLGFYHFDQIAGWTSNEVAWVDSNLEGFKGRVSRDEWVSQAKQLAVGGETEFSKRVDEGDVPSSQ